MSLGFFFPNNFCRPPFPKAFFKKTAFFWGFYPPFFFFFSISTIKKKNLTTRVFWRGLRGNPQTKGKSFFPPKLTRKGKRVACGAGTKFVLLFFKGPQSEGQKITHRGGGGFEKGWWGNLGNYKTGSVKLFFKGEFSPKGGGGGGNRGARACSNQGRGRAKFGGGVKNQKKREGEDLPAGLNEGKERPPRVQDQHGEDSS